MNKILCSWCCECLRKAKLKARAEAQKELIAKIEKLPHSVCMKCGSVECAICYRDWESLKKESQTFQKSPTPQNNKTVQGLIEDFLYNLVDLNLIDFSNNTDFESSVKCIFDVLEVNKEVSK